MRWFSIFMVLALMAAEPAEAQDGAQDGAQAGPQSVAGVTLPAAATVGDKKLRLQGGYLLRYKLFFKIYVAALYLPEGTGEQAALGEVPRRIEFHYQRALTAAQLVEATNGTVNRGRDDVAIAQIASQVAAFNLLYPDVSSGDVMTINYQPDRGTTMLINNVERGTIVGSDFSRALFGIWIGEHSFDPELKAALLGTTKP